MITVLRKAEYEALRAISLSGEVLDLGGSKNSEYHSLFRGSFSVTTANLAPGADIQCDFEKPLPIKDKTYDAVLLINVLEHVFEYRKLLIETARILRPGGMIVVVVPFLFPYHPSPNDFHRFTAPALKRALTLANFTNIQITSLGSGVFMAQFLLLERLLPSFLNPLLALCALFTQVGDVVFSKLAQVLKKKYQPSDYPLGFVVTARML